MDEEILKLEKRLNESLGLAKNISGYAKEKGYSDGHVLVAAALVFLVLGRKSNIDNSDLHLLLDQLLKLTEEDEKRK